MRLTFSDETPALDFRQLISQLPAGWVPEFLLEYLPGNDLSLSNPQQTESFFTDEANSNKQWITIKIAKLNRYQLDAFNPQHEAGTNTTVSGKPAWRRALDDGVEMLSFGPIDNYSIRVVSKGVDSKAIDEIATQIRLVNGDLVMSVSDALAPLRYRVTLKGGSLSLGNSAAEDRFGADAAVGYKRAVDSSKPELFINAVEVHGPDPLALIRFGGRRMAESGTVHGLAASVSELSGSGTMLTWVEGGRLIEIYGSFTLEELRPMAESVRTATDDEWAAPRAMQANR